LRIIRYLKLKIESLLSKIRIVSCYYFFKSKSVVIGNNLRIRGGNGKHSFGDNLVLYDNVIFECHSEGATIKTGKNCVFSFGVILSCSINIEMGSDVWVGEYTSIRDSSHQFSIEHPLSQTNDKKMPIKIGSNVWIGKNALILPGVVIGDNVIIAAGSVVKGECISNSLYAGNPAVFIKQLSR
jgi:acetyltransferase-like isoleucine patch superfamily enzyme